MGGCITSALTGCVDVEVVDAVLGTVSTRAGRGVGRWRRGESLRLIARRLGKRGPSVRAFVLQTGGVQWHPPRGPQRCLTMAEREEISRGVAAGEPCRQIAARLGRAPSTVSRELARNGGRSRYRVQVVVEVGVAAGERRGRRQADVKGKRPSRYGGWAAGVPTGASG